jgi:hypothetical protein
MDDAQILNHIEALVGEEQTLEQQEVRDASNDESLAADRQRLERISIELDRCWDLLRQRRARRAAGQDPDEAHARGPDTVERYLQ